MTETVQNLFRIDPASTVPLYDQIERNLRDMIINGHLAPGQTMPTESDLAESYGVSRLTIRRALDDLARQSWVEKKQGVGTFVRQPVTARIPASKLSFTAQMRAIGRVPGSKAIEQRLIPATLKIARALRIAEGGPVTELRRLRLADGVPILLETACLSSIRFPSLIERDWSQGQSLYEILDEGYGVTITCIDHTIKPAALTETEAHYLRSRAGAPALLSETIAYAHDGAPVEYAWSLSNGEQGEFYFHFQHTDTGA
jgi:GntR family transcriptional regulator